MCGMTRERVALDTRDMARKVALSWALCPAISRVSSGGRSDPGSGVEIQCKFDESGR
jgi:hypothetical protein